MLVALLVTAIAVSHATADTSGAHSLFEGPAIDPCQFPVAATDFRCGASDSSQRVRQFVLRGLQVHVTGRLPILAPPLRPHLRLHTFVLARAATYSRRLTCT